MKFSVIIPTYNRAALVREAIDSMLAQTFGDFELIVVNDGSTDDTAERLLSYQGKLTLINTPNRGLERAYDNGITAAQGEYLAFLDSDDLYFPDTLAGYAQAIADHGNPPLILGQPFFFHKSAELTKRLPESPVQHVAYPDYLSKGCTLFTTCSMFVIRRDVYLAQGGFRKDNVHRYFHEDFYLLLRLGLVSPVVVVRQPQMFAYRWHANNSVNNTARILKSISYLIAAERAGAFAGGKARRADRYALLAGTLIDWFKKAARRGEFLAGLELLLRNSDIVIIGAWKRTIRKVYH